MELWEDLQKARLKTGLNIMMVTVHMSRSVMIKRIFIHLLKMRILPGKPFKDPRKKMTPFLFNTAGAPHADAFNKLVNPHSLKKLQKQRGWAIVSTHLGKDFYRNKKLDLEFEKTIRYLAAQPGWYVPASQLLDFIKKNLGFSEISSLERFMMEYGHIIERTTLRIERIIKSLS